MSQAGKSMVSRKRGNHFSMRSERQHRSTIDNVLFDSRPCRLNRRKGENIMFFEFKHGGHALPKNIDKDLYDVGRVDIVTPEQAGEYFDPDTMTPFRYLIEDSGEDDLLPKSEDTVKALDELGAAMVDQDDKGNLASSTIPPIYTYWSQFSDRKLTARLGFCIDLELSG